MYHKFKQNLDDETGLAYAEAEAWQKAVCEVMQVESLPFKYSATNPNEYVKAKIEATRIMLSFVATGRPVLPAYMVPPEPTPAKGDSDIESEPEAPAPSENEPSEPVPIPTEGANVSMGGHTEAGPDGFEEIDIGEPPEVTGEPDENPDPDAKENGLREVPETKG